MKVYLQLAAIFLLFALVPFIPDWLDRMHVENETKRTRPKKVFRQTLAQGVQMGMTDKSGTVSVRCRTCTLEKRRKGPLTFGAFNVLRLEGLYVLIPPGMKDIPSRNRDRAANGETTTSSHESASRLGIEASFLKTYGLTQKFSGLAVDSLEVARLEGTNVVTAFTAEHGEAKRDGLHLTGCVVCSPSTNTVGKAVLRIKPRLRLVWRGGSLDLD